MRSKTIAVELDARRAQRPAYKPVMCLDGLSEPSVRDVEPQDYPWENAKI